jgi:xanthine/uracil permease
MIPKVGAIIALMPSAVLGGVLLFMFGMVASVGIDIIGSNMKTRRDALIVASSLALGLGIQAAPPAAFDVVLPALKILVTDWHRDGHHAGDAAEHRAAEGSRAPAAPAH